MKDIGRPAIGGGIANATTSGPTFGTLSVGVVLLGGVALAENIRGTFGPDNLKGTNQLDRISGSGTRTRSRPLEATTIDTAAAVPP
jgi:hypothetical protein